jgi:multisubunit Na+/H+ antiporter MnhG subunit
MNDWVDVFLLLGTVLSAAGFVGVLRMVLSNKTGEEE